MVVSNGGSATDTVISSGTAFVAKDGLMDSAEIHQGRIMVSGGGTVNSVYLNSGGTLTVMSGGTATIAFNPWKGGKIVSSGGAVVSHLERDANVYYGCDTHLISKTDVLKSETIDAGNSAFIFSGGQADLLTIGGNGVLLLSGGRANGTTVDSGGTMFVDDGGTADKTTVNSGGSMFVSGGGTASKTTVGFNAAMYVSGGAAAIDTTVSRGKMFVDGKMNGAVVARTAVCTINDGGRANDVTVSSGGTLSILRGGTAEGTVVLSSGRFAVSGGAADCVSVGKGGKAFIFSGGVLDGASVSSLGQLTVANGCKATGKMTWETGAVISAGSNAVFDFDLTRTEAGAEAIFNDISFITGAPKYTLTVDGTLEDGTYSLAGGATQFGSTISVVNTAGSELGSLTLAGGTQEIDGTKYTLNLDDGLLSVTLGEPPAPPLPDWTFFTGDFNGDGSDMLAVRTDNMVTIYQNGEPWGDGLTLDPGWSMIGTGDFDGDNLDDFLRVNEEGFVVGEMSNGNGTFTPQVLNLKSVGWNILGTGDFDGSGTSDILIANPTAASETVGLLGYWKGGTEWMLINGYSAEWECVSTGDFDGDGKCDMLWRNSFVGDGGGTYNAYCTWIVENEADWRMVSVANPDEWDFLCSGDFDGNGSHDIAMINDIGVVGIWGITDGYLSSWSILSAVTSEWMFAGVADFNADGTDDIAWASTATGLAGYWQINDRELTDWANLATIS